MADKDNKRGFLGISDLASEVSGIDESVNSEPKTEAKPSSSIQAPITSKGSHSL